ncbi:MAG: mechanosensitive ion channel [Lentisphaeria bacterium]|nr:mechanosensitive ion channel [Lentisphaeria bacterium]
MWESLKNYFESGFTLHEKALSSIVLLLVLAVLHYIGMRLVRAHTEEPRSRYLWRKVISYVVALTGFTILGLVWIDALSTFATFLGLVSAGIAVSLKDVFADLAGFLFILWRRPFEVGDRVEIGGHAGDVIDVRLFAFSLMEIGNWVEADQSTGRVLHIPNGWVLNHALANFGKGFHYIWDEIRVMVTFESNWERTRDLLQEIAERHSAHLSDQAAQRVREASKKYMIFYKKLTPIVYVSVAESGVVLTMRFLCEPRQRRGMEHAIWQDVLLAFRECDDIDFAYPTQRFFANDREGKTKSE